MIIKVKITDEDGQAKGRAYIYKSDIDVTAGEFVVADMAGHDKTLVVVETDLDPAEFDGVDYEIKTIKGLAEEFETEESPGIEIVVEEESLPVIKINFEPIKARLQEALEKYEGIVVTKQTLSGCKATQKELAGLRNKLDTYRKEKKKSLSKPIEIFEGQCKELIALIEKVEAPIKEGIKVFDDQKRNEKRQTAENLIEEVVSEAGLNEKYGARLDVSERYCNLTATETDVKNDLLSRAMALKVEQDREAELMEIIQDSIDTENNRIESKLKFEDFKRLIDRGVSTKDILAEVKAAADRIYRAEHPEPKPEVKSEPVAAPMPEPRFSPAPVAAVEEKSYFAVYRIQGTHSQLRSVSEFLKAKGITYKVTEQGEI